ncbi:MULTISPECIES: MFS transporter [unclassified Sphingomonas]|uniref:MFS transporter n=1 Tax=unclassified Sphingomonas TaxID=196159 RepID=UPI00226A765A|nr:MULTISPECIES: MFS transporter [unclassified Sphingomonas]
MSRSEFSRPAVLAAIGAWFGFLTGPNVMLAATNSNFLRVLPDALHTSRTTISTALAVSLWISAILVPIGGRLVDRLGLRRIVLPGIVLFSLVFLLLSQITAGWHFVVLQILMAVPISMHASPAYAKLISLWFDRNRGLVLGLCVALGAGLGQTIMPKLIQALIDTHGWRGGYLGIAAIVLVVGLPSVALLARTPKNLAIASQAETTAADSVSQASLRLERVGLSRAEALHRREFYQLFIAIMLGSFALLGTLQHAMPLLTERGLSVGTATSVISTAFAGVIAGQSTSGFFVDRINSPRVVLPYFVAALLGVTAIYTARSPSFLIPGALLMGLGLGGEISQNAYLVSRYFGLKAFGAIYGLTFAASAIGSGSGLIVLGFVRDHFGSYMPGRLLMSGAMLGSVLCIALLPSFTFDSQRAQAR